MTPSLPSRSSRLAPIARACALATALCGVMACGVPQDHWQFHRDLLDADRLADDGAFLEARGAYQQLAPRSHREDLTRYIRLRAALMLEREGRYHEALEEYAAIYTRPASLVDSEAARAMRRAAIVYRDGFGDTLAWREINEAVVRTFPNTIPVDDAVIDLARYWTERGEPRAFVRWVVEVYPGLAYSSVADNLVYRAARVLHEDADDPAAAIALYEVIRLRFHRSGFWDDAIWQTAVAYRELATRDPGYRDDLGQSYRDREYHTLLRFIDGREVSWVMGDYDSVHYSPTLFRLAEMHEEAGELELAIAMWRRFQQTYPLSLRVDDVQFHIMELQAERGDVSGMRRSLRWLEREYPLSRFIARGEALIAERTGAP